jgi:hypothetical protein
MTLSKYPTWTQMKAKLQLDLGIASEDFVTETEIMDYVNEAIEEAEGGVHTLYQDYFLKKQTVTLVNTTAEYTLADDIFGHNIRRVIYRNGSAAYVVKRVLDWQKFEEYAEGLIATGSGDYRYFIINETAGSPKLLLTPASYEAGAYVTVWYLRRATRMSTGASIMDIPEAANFVLQYAKVRVYEKEGNPRIVKAIEDLAREREFLNAKLATMIPDADNEIEMDTSIYEEMN